MHLPAARARILNNYQDTLFYNPTEPKSERVYVFYLLLRPMLSWVRDELTKYLEPPEAESELYLLCERLFSSYDKSKNSIVPYLERAIPWKVGHLMRRVTKEVPEDPSGLIDLPEEPYEINEEYYLTSPNVLLEDRYVGKCFTNGELWVINVILTSDRENLTQEGIANQCNIDKQTAKKRLSEIREVLNTVWRK